MVCLVSAIYGGGGMLCCARPARKILFLVCCIRGTKTFFFAFARENSGVQPLATSAAEAEMKQLHWRNTFRPVRWNELSQQQKDMVLESHIHLTKKRSGEIKGRTVAGGNKQRGYIEKEDASSPTVATESVILTSLVDAIEQ